MNPQPDVQALALTKAIRQQESGGNYKAVGDAGTSTGAYQFQPATWKQYSKEILGDENAQMSEENQNAVAYGKIKKWKDSGLGPAEIAAAWNAGEGSVKSGSWTKNIGTTSINGQQIQYNTPKYAQDVVNTFKQLYPQLQAQYPGTEAPAAQEKTLGGFIGNIGSSASNLVEGIGSAIAHPIDTLSTLGGTAVGVAQKLIPGEQDQEKYANAMGQYLKERYGGANELGNTIYNDPVGFLTDLSSVLSGGGAALTKVGRLSKVGEIAKVGSVVSKLDPVVQAAKAVDNIADFAKTKAASAAVKLEGSNLAWTVGQKAKKGARIDEINKFGAKLENVGDPATRLEVGQAIVDEFKTRMDFAAEQSLVLVSKESVIKELEALRNGIKARPNYSKLINGKIDDAIDGLDSIDGTHVTAGEINSLKKDFDSAINYDSVSRRITNEGRATKTVADYFRNKIVKEMDALGETINGTKLADFNHQFGIAAEYAKQLQTALGKGGPGLVGKGMGSFVGNKLGEAVGGLPGEILGTMAGEKVAEKLGGVKSKSYLGSKLTGATKPAGKVTKTVKSTLKKATKPGYYAQEIEKNKN